jgi:hypothetical protein
MMIRVPLCLVLAGVLSTGCAPPEPDPGDDLDGDDAKEDGVHALGVDPMSPAACAILQVAGGHDRAGLVALGVPPRAAGEIAAYRAAEDRLLGTPDDRALTSLAELDAIPGVGAVTLRSLRDASRELGIVCGGGMVRVEPVRRGAPAAELWGAFRDGDGPWRPLPPTDGPLVFPVADAGGRYGFALLCRNEASDWGRVAPAVSTFELTTAEARELVLDADLGLWSCGSRWLEPEAGVRIDLDQVQGEEIVVAALGRDTNYFSTPRVALKPTGTIADLLVHRRPGRELYPPTAAFVQRDVAVLPGLRLALTREAFVPLLHRRAPVLRAADNSFGVIRLRSASGTEMSLGAYAALVAGSDHPFAVLPAELERATDVFIVKTYTFPFDPEMHRTRTTRYVAHPEEVVLDAPAVTRPGGHVAQGAAGTVLHFQPYPGAALYAFDLLGRQGAGWIVVRSAARVAERAAVPLPVFAGVRGWDPAWQLPATFSSGPSVLLADGGNTADLFVPARRVGMTLTTTRH